jgi:hypothetical protein
MRGVVVGVSEFNCWRRGTFGLILLGPVLAGCSSSMLPSMPSVPSMPSSVTSMFGSKTAAGNANAASTTGLGSQPANFECPDVTVRQGASTLSASANPAEPTALNLRYQVTIGTTARECRVQGNTVSIKVGMEGRVILGPQGSPGPIDVPIRFAVVEEGIDPKVIVTKLDRVAVMVPPDDGNMLFSHVAEGLEFQMPKGGAIDSYVIYIGFDPLSVQEQEKKRPAPKAKPKKKTS